jgi:DNA helicase-2/ATP-dependent DNA helicase PcrA
LLRRAADPDIVKLAELAEQADVTSLMEAAQGLAIDDLDWINDWRQIERAWNLFLDRSEAAERSFGNFRQHLIRCQRGDPKEPGVRLLTVHKAQGQEFKAVAVIGCNDGQFPDFRAVGEDAMAAEVRTFYVAISRPSRWLLLTRAESRVTRFGPRLTSESPFLELIRPAL